MRTGHASDSQAPAAVGDLARVSSVQELATPARGPRVLQVLPALGHGGVERGTFDVARYLIDKGWTALVASNGGPTESQLRQLGAVSVTLPLHSKNPLVMQANIGRLVRIIRDYDVQLVHARSRAPAWSAYYAARRCGVPFVTTFHGVYSGSEQFLKRSYNAIMASGERVIAISDFVAEHVVKSYGVPQDRLRVITRGVDLATFDPDGVAPARLAALRAAWDLPPDRRIIMLPGRVTWVKGHMLLLQALKALNRQDVLCLFVGTRDPNASYVAQVERAIIELRLDQTVALVGACDDMPAAYVLADVVVVPSVGLEAFGRTSIEAQAMGKPVIVTDVGGLSETVMPAATGWLVPPDQPRDLAAALDLALAMPEDARTRLAQRSRRFIDRHYTIQRMGKKTMAVYRELLDGRRPSADTLVDLPYGTA
jgi:glycosyltransferase involved in cell wall biosynthesis